MRRVHLRGHENILKRVLLQAGAFNVDSRYMLWNMAELDGAVNLLEESPSRLKYRRVPHLRSNLLLPFPRSRRGDNLGGPFFQRPKAYR